MAKSSKEETVVVDMLSPEWNGYLMEQFAPEELQDGNPVVAGLRRLAEKFIGKIVKSSPTGIWPIVGDGLGRATVSYGVTFKLDDETLVEFADVADSWHGNTEESFLPFATAIAATRAEARALRKALKLRTVAAEELSKTLMKVSEDKVNQDIITDNQKLFIDKICKELDINAVAFMNNGERTYRGINEVLKQTASKMIQVLNDLKNNREEISADIQGYKSEWLVNFK